VLVLGATVVAAADEVVVAGSEVVVAVVVGAGAVVVEDCGAALFDPLLQPAATTRTRRAIATKADRPAGRTVGV